MNGGDLDAPGSVISLADRIERDSRAGVDVRLSLDELQRALSAWSGPHGDDRTTADALARMHRIVDQLQRDLDRGKVRSISGLSAEARRLARSLARSG